MTTSTLSSFMTFGVGVSLSLLFSEEIRPLQTYVGCRCRGRYESGHRSLECSQRRIVPVQGSVVAASNDSLAILGSDRITVLGPSQFTEQRGRCLCGTFVDGDLWVVVETEKVLELWKKFRIAFDFISEGIAVPLCRLTRDLFVYCTRHSCSCFDTTTGALRTTINAINGFCYDGAVSRDGRIFATCHLSGTLCLWDTTDGSPIAYPDLSGFHRVCTFSPTSSALAVQTSGSLGAILHHLDGSIVALRVHDVFLHHGQNFLGDVIAMAFSPDGKRLAATTYRFIVGIWDAVWASAAPRSSPRDLLLWASHPGSPFLPPIPTSLLTTTKLSPSPILLIDSGYIENNASDYRCEASGRRERLQIRGERTTRASE